jgi:hypothetical protein
MPLPQSLPDFPHELAREYAKTKLPEQKAYLASLLATWYSAQGRTALATHWTVCAGAWRKAAEDEPWTR